MFCKTKTKPKVSEKRGNWSEFHSKRNYLLQNWYFNKNSVDHLLLERVISRFLQVLSLQPRISKVFLNPQNNFFLQQIRTILVIKYHFLPSIQIGFGGAEFLRPLRLTLLLFLRFVWCLFVFKIGHGRLSGITSASPFG